MVGIRNSVGKTTRSPSAGAIEPWKLPASEVLVKRRLSSAPRMRPSFEHPERRKGVAALHRRLERAEQVGDGVRIVADERSAARQDRETVAAGGEHAPHPQHSPRAIERLVDVAVGAKYQRVELNQR